MKKSVKFLFTLFSASIFVYFSCASKPSVPAADSTVIQEAADQLTEPSENIDETEKETEAQPEPENTTETKDYSDLEEALTEEQNPELPELPAEKKQEQENKLIPEEPEITPEPPVKDEPAVEAEKISEKNEKKEVETKASTATKAEEKDSKEENSENEKNSEIEKNTEEEAPAETVTVEEITEPGKVSVMPNPSRSITIQKNQLIDIIYPGKGWIYQGSIDEEGNIDTRNRNFIFGGRKLGGKDTAFTLRSRNAGTYILHFFKNDTLTGNYIDDYLEVIVQNKAANSTEHILAPDYASIVPPAASITAEKIKEEQKQKKLQEEQAHQAELETKKAGEKPAAAPAKKQQISTPSVDSSIDTIIQTTESAPGANAPAVKTENKTEKKTVEQKKVQTAAKEQTETGAENLDGKTADQLLESAQKHYGNKEYPQAYSAITRFFDKASSRLDEGLYLQGQILEEKSPVQNIKDAIESYDLIVKNYPSSSLWDKANKRSIFLKRFYINIR